MKKLAKGLLRFLIEAAALTVLVVGLRILTDGMYLLGLPDAGDIQSVQIAYPSVTEEAKEVSSREEIELTLKLTGFLKYDLFGEADRGEEPAITITCKQGSPIGPCRPRPLEGIPIEVVCCCAKKSVCVMKAVDYPPPKGSLVQREPFGWSELRRWFCPAAASVSRQITNPSAIDSTLWILCVRNKKPQVSGKIWRGGMAGCEAWAGSD